LDIFIQRDEINADKLIQKLQKFGFGSLDLTKEDFLKPDFIIQLGVPPVRIDILTSISGVEFDEAWKIRVQGKYGSQVVYFISKEDLKKNKKAS